MGSRILTNRKRAIVALVHSVAFLLLAIYGFVTVVRPLERTSPASAWILVSVYGVVTSILLALVIVSGSPTERLYFAFCTTSAGFGMLRQIFGDPQMRVAVYVRVSMLACAVLTGVAMVRRFRSVQVASTAD